MKKSVTVDIPENVTLKRLRLLQYHLERLADDPDCEEIILQGQDVARVDTAGIQLLSSFCVTGRAAGKRVEWKAPSKKLCTAAEILGLDRAMGLSRCLDMAG